MNPTDQVFYYKIIDVLKNKSHSNINSLIEIATPWTKFITGTIIDRNVISDLITFRDYGLIEFEIWSILGKPTTEDLYNCNEFWRISVKLTTKGYLTPTKNWFANEDLDENKLFELDLKEI